MRGRNISFLIFRIRAVHTVYDVAHILIFHAGFLFLRLIFCRHKILDLNRRDVIYERPHIFLPFSFSLDLVRYPRNRIVKWDLLKLGIVSKNWPLWSRSKNYINFTNIYRTAFAPISFRQKHYKHNLYAHKRCAKHFHTKKLLLKCCWIDIWIHSGTQAMPYIDFQMPKLVILK